MSTAKIRKYLKPYLKFNPQCSVLFLFPYKGNSFKQMKKNTLIDLLFFASENSCHPPPPPNVVK